MGLRILFTITIIINCCLVAGYLGAKFVSPSDGMAGGAVVFWFIVVGFIAGCLLGIFLSRRLSRRLLFRAWIITCALALVLFVIAYFRYTEATDENISPEPKNPTTVPIRMSQRDEQPMGLGMTVG